MWRGEHAEGGMNNVSTWRGKHAEGGINAFIDAKTMLEDKF